MGIAGGSLPISFFGIAYEVSVATTYWGTLPELMEVIALAASRPDPGPACSRSASTMRAAAYQAMRDGALEGRAVIVPS